MQRSLNQKIDPFRGQLEERIPVGDGEIQAGIELITIEALQEGIPTATIEQFIATDKFLPRPFMVIVRSDKEGMELIRLGMDDEGKIDLMKSTIGKGKQHFMMKARGPDKPVGTGVVPGFDIGRGHNEIRFRFNPMEKIAEAQVHRIILELVAHKCNSWGWAEEELFPERLADNRKDLKRVADRKTPATTPAPIPP